jgi:hypothetical protein
MSARNKRRSTAQDIQPPSKNSYGRTSINPMEPAMGSMGSYRNEYGLEMAGSEMASQNRRPTYGSNANVLN